MMKFMKKTKKGVTLVESVFAVVILSILTIGIISLLTAGGVKIFQISSESAAYSAAVQKMDLLIASISNGSSDYIVFQPGESDAERSCRLNISGIENKLGVTVVTKNSKTRVSTYDNTAKDLADLVPILNVRGWYITIVCNGIEVSGFASNSEGVFDVQ